MIKAAAILHNDVIYTLPKPNRHHNIINSMHEQGFGPSAMLNQGFITEDGTYVTREEAAIIAYNAGQTLCEKTTLYTEDLW